MCYNKQREKEINKRRGNMAKKEELQKLLSLDLPDEVLKEMILELSTEYKKEPEVKEKSPGEKNRERIAEINRAHYEKEQKAKYEREMKKNQQEYDEEIAEKEQFLLNLKNPLTGEKVYTEESLDALSGWELMELYEKYNKKEETIQEKPIKTESATEENEVNEEQQVSYSTVENEIIPVENTPVTMTGDPITFNSAQENQSQSTEDELEAEFQSIVDSAKKESLAGKARQKASKLATAGADLAKKATEKLKSKNKAKLLGAIAIAGAAVLAIAGVPIGMSIATAGVLGGGAYGYKQFQKGKKM